MDMKKLTILIICIVFFAPLQSFSSSLKDSTSAKHEFTVSYNRTNFGSASLNYSRRLTQKTWLRFGLDVFGDFVANQPLTGLTYYTSNFSSTSTFLLGVEKHKSIKSNFELITGLNLIVISGMSYTRIDNPSLPIKMQRSVSFDFHYGFGGTVGLYYRISDKFAIGSSINPCMTYSRSLGTINNVHSFRMYLTNMSIVTLRYKL
jgi:hypothetical protein